MASPKNKGTKLFFSQYGGEQPIPPEFIAAMNRTEEIQPVPNDVGAETLSDTIVESKVETNRTNERVRRTVKKTAGNIGPLHVIHINDRGLPVQVSRTMMPTAYAIANPSVPTATSTPADQDLGNGWTIREVGIEGSYVAGVFTAGSFPELWENIFDPERGPVLRRTKLVTDTTTGASLTVASTTISKTEYEPYPSNPLLRKRILETWIVPGPVITSTEFEKDGIKKVVTRQQMLASSVVTSEVLSAGTLTRKFEERLNELLAWQIIETITVDSSSLLDLPTFAKQREDAVPPRFKKATPEITEKHVVSGTASAPSLSSGDVAKSERQETTQTKETSVTNKAVGGYPTLSGQTYDESLDVEIPYTEAIVADGTGGARADITPLGTDIYGSAVALKKAIDTVALFDALDAYLAEFPGTTNLVLPDILESVEIIWNEGSGEGSFDSEWEGYASGTSGSLGGSEAGNAQGSASLMPELAIHIKQTWAKNMPTTRSFFFLPLPISIGDILGKVSAIASWPVFHPVGHTIVLHGMKVAVDAKAQGAASVAFSDSGSSWDRSEGSGTSEDVNAMVSAVNIPPTIHGSIGFSDVDRTLDAVAHATASWVGYNFPSINATATATKTANAFVWPEGLDATTPSTIPSSGIYLIDSHVEIYGYGYGKCYAETLDASVLA